jgi:tetratricopeptide (TPR) repeat protein
VATRKLAPEALDQLGTCLGLGILAADRDSVAFRHELARLAVEDSLSPWRRVSLHRRALEALSGAAPLPDLARLAHHAEAAGDAAAVARYAPAAAVRAAALGAHREASAQYSRALGYGGPLDPRTRAELLERHSNECYLSDRGSEAIASGRAAVQAYHELGDSLLEADALCKLSTMQRVSGHIAGAEQSLAAALALLEDAPVGRELAMAYATTAQIAMCNGDSRQTTAAGERALELAEGLSETEIRLHTLVTIGTMQVEAASGAPEGWATLQLSLQLAKDAGVDEQVGRAYNNLIHEGMRFRRFGLVDAWVADAVDYCTERGLELWLRLALGPGRNASFTGPSGTRRPRPPGACWNSPERRFRACPPSRCWAWSGPGEVTRTPGGRSMRPSPSPGRPESFR